MIKALTSSNSILWETPQDLFDRLNSQYHFNTDVCGIAANAKCKHYYSPEIDGLKQEWRGVCWMNPPYGRAIWKWIEKAFRESKKGTVIVALLPARTDTKWFHRFIYKKRGVRTEFIKGRLRFENSNSPAPFPSMLVFFGKAYEKR